MLTLRPITLREANAFVLAHHRHLSPTQGGLWAVSAVHGSKVVGVAVVGRPCARTLQDGCTAEVRRLCTTGERNACSLLYGATSRAARALGYKSLVTYTLDSETGASLRAAGWVCDRRVPAQSWERDGRTSLPGLLEPKSRWWAPWSAALQGGVE